MVSPTLEPLESVAGAPPVASTELAAGRRGAAQVTVTSAERRERLLSASAAASRLLLQAPDVMAVVPKVLQLVGEAADADRVSLMLTQPDDRDRLALAAEWRAQRAARETSRAQPAECVSLERWSKQHPGLSGDLCCGRSVLCYEGAVDCAEQAPTEQCASDNTKALVPIFVGAEFVGVVGFVSHGERREIGSAELSALETAAGVIGAALHRERLVDAVRRERERALINDKAAVLRKLEQLAAETELGAFLGGHVLIEAAERLEAAAGAVVVRDAAHDEWRVLAYMRDGRLEPAPYPATLPLTVEDPVGISAARDPNRKWVPKYLDLAGRVEIQWPEMIEQHRRLGDSSLLVFPLVFGDNLVGFMLLGFKRAIDDELRHGDSEVLVGLSHAATIAIEFARRTDAARDVAVLAERNRIAQEIHDGIAQAFTGILLQLNAAEQPAGSGDSGPHAALLARIANLAREGLADARRSVMALRPEPSRCRRLESALRELAERSTIPGRITTTLDGSGWPALFTPEHEHELLRIAQEAVSNAVRHARPKTIRISMTGDETHWVLAVVDDGVGLPSEAEIAAQDGFGLTSMRERAAAIGAEWSIASRRGAGTTVTVRIPKQVSP